MKTARKQLKELQAVSRPDLQPIWRTIKRKREKICRTAKGNLTDLLGESLGRQAGEQLTAQPVCRTA